MRSIAPEPGETLHAFLRRARTLYLEQLLQDAGGKVTAEAIQRSGINRATLYRELAVGPPAGFSKRRYGGNAAWKEG